MSKRLCITVSDFVFNNYLTEIKTNRSQYIEMLIQVGTDSLINEDKIKANKLIRLIAENQDLRNKNRELELRLNNYKDKKHTHREQERILRQEQQQQLKAEKERKEQEKKDYKKRVQWIKAYYNSRGVDE